MKPALVHKLVLWSLPPGKQWLRREPGVSAEQHALALHRPAAPPGSGCYQFAVISEGALGLFFGKDL